MSPMKEPHFFSRIEPAARWEAFFPHVSEEDEYLALFEGAAGPAGGRGGEHAPTCGTPTPPSGSSEAVPEAKILIVLRDPVDRAYSHYLNDVREGMERRSFLDALAAEQRDGPGGWGVSSLYIDCGRYAEQVARYLDRFGGKVKVLFFDDFVARRAGDDRGGPGVPGRAAAAERPGRADEPGLPAPQQAQRGRARQRQAAPAGQGHHPSRGAGPAALRPAEALRRAHDGPRRAGPTGGGVRPRDRPARAAHWQAHALGGPLGGVSAGNPAASPQPGGSGGRRACRPPQGATVKVRLAGVGRHGPPCRWPGPRCCGFRS